MRRPSLLLALAMLGSALVLGACGASPDASPAASTVATQSDVTLTASGYGPGASPSPGTGTGECDGTGQGPGPGSGSGPGNGKGNGSGPGDGLCGAACTGPVGPDPADITTLLELALQEEYKAQMLYQSVLEDFAEARPFTTIVESEARHVEVLQLLFTRRALAPPASVWAPASFPPFASLPLACAAGVQAEREDAAFYAPYLERSDLPQDVRTVFTNLQAASLENHLPAFERCQ